MNAEQCQMAADLWTKPTNLSQRSAYRQHVTTSTIAISSVLVLHKCVLLFTITQKCQTVSSQSAQQQDISDNKLLKSSSPL